VCKIKTKGLEGIAQGPDTRKKSEQDTHGMKSGPWYSENSSKEGA
jgi:hypothetical protein